MVLRRKIIGGILAALALGGYVGLNSLKPNKEGENVKEYRKLPIPFVGREEDARVYEDFSEIDFRGSLKEDYLEKERKNLEDMRISEGGLELIMGFEGFRARRYDPVPNDGKDEWTIGYGHLIKGGENYVRITKEEGAELFRRDVRNSERIVKEYVSVRLTQSQFDALCSLVYNIGEENFRKSTLLKRLNEGDYSAAQKEFLRWNRASGKVLKGLIKRRFKESELFGEGS